MMSAFSTTMVIETKEGKAKRLIDDMKGLLEKVRVPFSDNAAGFTIELQNFTGKPGAFYVKNVGNFIVIANHPIKENNDNPLVKSSNLDEYLNVFCAGLSPDNQLMRDLNLKTPDDLAVIGFDVSDIYQLYSTSVTHIVQPLKALGEKSVEVLVNMIQGKPAESVILKPEMVEGNSTAAKK